MKLDGIVLNEIQLAKWNKIKYNKIKLNKSSYKIYKIQLLFILFLVV